MRNLLLTTAAWLALMSYNTDYPPTEIKYLRASWRWLHRDFFNGLNGDF